MIKSSSISFVGTFATGFLYSVFLSRLLGAEGRGDFFELQMYSLVVSGIIGPALGQYLYEISESIKDLVRSILFSCLLIFVVAVFIGLIFYYLSYYDFSTLMVLMFLLASQSFMIFMLELTKFSVDLALYQIVLFFQSLVLFISVAILYFLAIEIDVNEMVMVAIVSYFIVSFAIILLVLLNYRSSSSGDVTIARFFSIAGFRGVGSVINYFDRFLIIALADSKVLGGVAVCYSLESISSRFFQYFSNIRMNLIVNSSSAKLVMMNYMVLLCGVVGVLLTYYLGSYFLSLFFGGEFTFAHSYLVMIILISVLNGVSWYYSQSWTLFSSHKYIYYKQILGVLFVIFMFGLNFFIPGFLEVIHVFGILVVSSMTRLFYTLYINARLRGCE